MMKNMIAYERMMLKLSRDKYNRKIITKEELKSYFKEICELYDIQSAKQVHKYPDQRFFEIRNINISIM